MVASLGIKSFLADVYRRALPGRLRDPIWHATRAAWAAGVLWNSREARTRYAEYLVARGQHRVVVQLCDGFALKVDLRDQGVGRVIYVNRTYEPMESDFLKSKLRAGMTV